MSPNVSHCQYCNLPLATSARAGSLTSFLFMDMHCQCDSANPAARRVKPTSDSQSCKRCGKVIAGPKRKGSFTAFLLKDMRCQCDKPLIDTGSGQKPSLQTRFHRPSGAGFTRKQTHETMRRTRAAILLKQDTQLVSLTPGQVIGGCYQLSSLIGQGGMGLVYKARHTTLGRTCALKFLAPSMVSSASWQLFQKEAQIISSLTHPTICHIYDLGIHASTLPFYAMDYLAGRTVEQIISDDGPLSVGATVEIAIKVAEGLSYAHRRSIVHKDIKPANIMLVPNEQGGIDVKLLDFGISQLTDTHGADVSQTADEIVGSAIYMSPEQFTDGTVDLRSDIYSLGCTIFETLSGRTPFESDDVDELAHLHSKSDPPLLAVVTGMQFPLEVEAVIRKCLEKNADNRYQNANELAIDLQRILDQKPLQFAREQLNHLNPASTVSAQNATTSNATATIAITAIAIVILLVLTAGTIYWIVDQNAKHSTQTASKELPQPSAAEQKAAANAFDLNSINKSTSKAPDYFEQGLLKDIGKNAKPAQTVDKAVSNPLTERFDSVTFLADSISNEKLAALTPSHVYKSAGKGFYKGLQKDSSGKVFRVFDFGKQMSLGTIFCSPDIANRNNQEIRQECIGVVKLPATGDIVYSISGELTNPEVVLANLNSGEVQGLDLNANHEHAMELMLVLKKFKGLRFLRLSGFQQCAISQETIAAMHSLKRLILIDWHNDLKYPLLIPSDIKLVDFELGYGRGTLPSFFALPAEQNPIKDFEMVEIPIKKEDLVYISRMKQLEVLTLSQVHLDAQLFKLLEECKNLKGIALRDHMLEFGGDQIRILGKLNNLKSVFIECDSLGGVELKAIELRLKLLLPHASVMVH